MAVKRQSLGRQKIAIAKIAKRDNLQVTFSKRRSGIFKKASELCTLCGVEIGMIVFSPANRAFSFGHPDVESIFHRFLSQKSPQRSLPSHHLFETHRNARVQAMNTELSQILTCFEAEKMRGKVVDEARELGRGQNWWENPVDELGLPELEQLKFCLEELKINVEKHSIKILMEPAASSLPFLDAKMNFFCNNYLLEM